PFGETLTQSGPVAESRGWIGQKNDQETGLIYLHARYLDPQLGTFASPDPLDPSKPGVGTNRYSYSYDDPINNLDPSGLDCWTDTEYGIDGKKRSVSRGGTCPSLAQAAMNAPDVMQLPVQPLGPIRVTGGGRGGDRRGDNKGGGGTGGGGTGGGGTGGGD